MTHVGSTIRTQVRTHGAVTPDATDYAVAKLDAALHHAPAPVVGSWLSGSAPACGACAAVPPMTQPSWLSPVTTSLSTGVPGPWTLSRPPVRRKARGNDKVRR